MIRFNVRIEAQLGERWEDITPDVYQRDAIEITRGRPDETSRVKPGKCKLTINNRGGRYSPRNPEGPYYGLLGRNTPLRVRIGDPPTASWRWSTFNVADHVAVSTNLYGDSGLLICAWIANFDPGDYTVPDSMTKDAETDAEGSTMASAREVLTSGGSTGNRTATFSQNSDGHATSAIAVPGESGAPTVEEFWDDHRFADDVTFVTGDDTQVDWLLVAVQGWQYDNTDSMPANPGGTTSTAWTLLADSERATGRVARIKVWSRRVLTAGPQEVVFPTAGDGNRNNHARLYVLSGVPFSSDRFSGEVSAWPPRWDPSESDVYIPIEAAGIFRRLGQGARALASAVRRQTLSAGTSQPVAYWPCEDDENATSIASALSGGEPMSITGVSDLAAYDGFAASEPLPQMSTSTFSGTVPDYDAGDQQQVQWLMAVPSDGADDLVPIIDVYTTGSAARWQVRYHVDGLLSIHVFNTSGVEIHDSGLWDFDVDGLLLRSALELTQNGSDIDWRYGQVQPGASGGTGIGQTIAGETVGRIQRVVMAANRADASIGDTAVGHVTVYNTITSIHDLGDAWGAWRGEPAGRRIERLCREEDIVFRNVGDLNDTEPMGPQGVDTLLALLQNAADADGGILHETRDEIGLSYRTRASMYNQGL